MTNLTSSRPCLGQESGFTLIELLVTIAILGILSGLSIASFLLYKENAEYAKGAALLKNARTAYGVGELELPDGYNLAFTQTDTSGSELSGELARVMPGGKGQSQVRLGVEVSACTDRSGPLDRQVYIVSEPCQSEQQVRWQRFCGGIEVLSERVANPTPCT